MTSDGGGGPAQPRPVARPGPWRPARLWHPAPGAGQPLAPGWGPLPELLLGLTIVTGVVDAVSILAPGRVFVANMTGNVVFAGFAIIGAPGFSLGASLFALAGFLVADAVAALLAVAMGIQNAAARKLAVPDLTTTVLTMTLTGIGADTRAGHRSHVALSRRLLAVATMLGGGILGAWLVLQVSAVAAIAVAVFVLLVTAAGAAGTARAPAAWRAAK